MDTSFLNDFNLLDYIISALLIIFIIQGLFRGFVTELWSAAAFIASVFLTINRPLHDWVNSKIQTVFSSGDWSGFFTYLIVFSLSFAVVSFLGKQFGKAIGQNLSGATNHLLGILVGGLKGVAISILLMLCLQHWAPGSELVQKSVIVPHLNDFWKSVNKSTGNFFAIPELSEIKLN